MLEALREHGLLRGKNLGIDTSVIEANASLRALVHRNTEEQYWDYVKRLAAEQGIDPEDSAAVRKLDRKRPGKGSNAEWKNPHDPDAKIGRTKDGATDMIYKPESVVDLDTGAVVQAEVQLGDKADHKTCRCKFWKRSRTLIEWLAKSSIPSRSRARLRIRVIMRSMNCSLSSRKAFERSLVIPSTTGVWTNLGCSSGIAVDIGATRRWRHDGESTASACMKGRGPGHVGGLRLDSGCPDYQAPSRFVGAPL
jgi:hypothetical protein